MKFLKKAQGNMTKGQKNLVDVTTKIASTCVRMETTMSTIIENMKAEKTGAWDIDELIYMHDQMKEFKKTFRRFSYFPGLAEVPRNFQRNIDRLAVILKAVQTVQIDQTIIRLAEDVLKDLHETGQGTMDTLSKV